MADQVDEELVSKEEEQSSSDDSNEVPPSDIVAFNELRSCSDLVRLFESGQLEIDPEFQRDVVWPATNQTRFIDSLAKQLPIPSMCISLDYRNKNKRQVVDGLQRISSIIKFLTDPKWRLSKLDDIDPRLSGKTVQTIKADNATLYEIVENASIPVTILRCDLSKRSHQEYMFTIFHRLNTGSVKLTNQEIRNCIFEGSFNNMLKSIVKTEDFIQLFGVKEGTKYRFSFEELVLRILSHSKKHSEYKGPLAKHLNTFMSANRKNDEEVNGVLKDDFLTCVNLVYNQLLGGEELPRLSKATTEALFVGVLRNLQFVQALTRTDFKNRFHTLLNDPLFSVDALKEGLAAREKVIARLDRAVEIFG